MEIQVIMTKCGILTIKNKTEKFPQDRSQVNMIGEELITNKTAEPPSCVAKIYISFLNGKN